MVVIQDNTGNIIGFGSNMKDAIKNSTMEFKRYHTIKKKWYLRKNGVLIHKDIKITNLKEYKLK